MLDTQNLVPSFLGARGIKSAIGLFFKVVYFEARVMELSTNVLEPNIRLFVIYAKLNSSLFGARWFKSTKGLIFKMLNFNARLIQLFTYVLELKIFCFYIDNNYLLAI